MIAKRIAVAAAAAVLAMTSAASAAKLTPPAENQRAGGPAGVQEARDQGIEIPPGLAERMAKAPAGSCANDPVQPTCPPITEVAPAPGFNDETAKASRTRSTASAAQLTAAGCTGYIGSGSPWRAAGYAQMNSRTFCTRVSRLEVFNKLLKRYNGDWTTMSTEFSNPADPNKWTYYNVKYRCGSSPHRYWHARLEVYFWLSGKLFFGDGDRYDWLDCGS